MHLIHKSIRCKNLKPIKFINYQISYFLVEFLSYICHWCICFQVYFTYLFWGRGVCTQEVKWW